MVDKFLLDFDSTKSKIDGWEKSNPVQIINPDIDGLISAAILYSIYGWPVAGYYDTKTLLIGHEYLDYVSFDHELNLHQSQSLRKVA